jgi:signal-transduction protein with cAMP-binding, CBS, and nucleotidyltransferase domain
MGTVSDIIAGKSRTVHRIGPDSTVFEAVQGMVEHGVGALLVAQDQEILGIITERDYLRRIVIENRSSRTTAVREIMSARLVCVDPSTTIEDCMSLMTRLRIRHLPVMEQRRVVAMVSMRDVVRQLATEQEVHIRYLTDYIADRYPG